MPKIAAAANLKSTQQIRYQRFDELMDFVQSDREEKGLPKRGQVKDLADRCGLSERYVSHIVNHRKPIGTRTARALEKGMGKPTNWMDTLGVVEEQNEDVLIVELAKRAYARDPKKTSKALIAIIEAAAK